jgi:hypothetical protein
MESSGGKGRLTLAHGDSRFDGSKTDPAGIGSPFTMSPYSTF